MKLRINDRTVEARPGESVLQCAVRHDISIPRLCAHPALPAYGACRLCVVEIDGMRGYPASCATPAAAGMVVRTDTEALRELRRGILELILLEHPSSCLICDKQELCDRYRPHAAKAGRTTTCHTCNNKEVCAVRDLAAGLGVSDLPVPPIYRNLPLDRSDPFIDRDLNLCILCGRCVRICKSQHGQSAIELVGRGSRTHVGQAFGRSLLEAGCRFCGSCIDVCPTGSLADRYGKWFGAGGRFTATTCQLCDAGCAITVSTSRDRRVVRTRALSPRVPICALGRFAMPELLNDRRRLDRPRVRTGEVLREQSWEDALARAAERLKPFVGDRFALVCDRTSTLEDRHVFRRFVREVMRSPHYLEIEPDASGRSTTRLPEGVRAALLTGDFIAREQLARLDLLIVQDCYPAPEPYPVEFSFPVSILAEVSGTAVDAQNLMRPLNAACNGPGQARPDWRIVCELARHLGASGFDYASVAAIGKELGAEAARLRIRSAATPPAAADPARLRTYFRGHRLADVVGGLCELAPAERAAAVGE